VVAGDQVHDFTVPGTGADLKPAVPWSGRFYVADESNGVVYVLDRSGQLVDTINYKEARGPIDLEVRENRLFINAPNAATARVVDDSGNVKIVDKFVDDVLGGDPPKVDPPKPDKPPVGKPGGVRNLKAVAGNTQAGISWGKADSGGSPITKYMVEGNGQTFTVGANQRSLAVTGLVNGQKYTFTVWAVNAKGAGPKRTSNPVVPSFETPDPPTNAKAVEKPDGSVVVTWDKANGQGHKIPRYELTAASNGAGAPIRLHRGGGQRHRRGVEAVRSEQHGRAVRQAGRGEEPQRRHGHQRQGHDQDLVAAGLRQRPPDHRVRRDRRGHDQEDFRPDHELERPGRRRDGLRVGGGRQRGGRRPGHGELAGDRVTGEVGRHRHLRVGSAR